MPQETSSKRRRQRYQIYKVRAQAQLQVFKLLGGKCRLCPQADYGALVLDHKNGQGAAARRGGHSKGKKLAVQILRGHVKLEDFQLLCASCNQLKETYGPDPSKWALRRVILFGL